jgi:hypothetical protein
MSFSANFVQVTLRSETGGEVLVVEGTSEAIPASDLDRVVSMHVALARPDELLEVARRTPGDGKAADPAALRNAPVTSAVGAEDWSARIPQDPGAPGAGTQVLVIGVAVLQDPAESSSWAQSITIQEQA